MESKYIATLLGCGIGDMLGMPVEGWKKSQIERHAGRITKPIAPVIVRDASGNIAKEDKDGRLKSYSGGLSLGDYTDDTILTLAIAESIAEKQCLDFEDLVEKQVHEYKIRKLPNGKVIGGFGQTTMDAFENIINGMNPLRSAVYPGLGNGVAMKTSPIGLFMHATNDINGGLRNAVLIGAATHGDNRATAAGTMQAYAVYSLLNNMQKDNFLENMVDMCIREEGPFVRTAPLADKGTLASRLRWVNEHQNIDDDAAFEYLGNSSLAIESYPFTVFMFQKYWDKPIEGLIETVNFGGDCDSTGAIYGSLCGAKNGMIFPQEWTDALNGSKRLIDAAKGIWKIGEKAKQK